MIPVRSHAPLDIPVSASSSPVDYTGPTVILSELRDQFIRYGYKIAQHSPNTMTTRSTHMKFFIEFCQRQGVIEIGALTNPVIDEFFVEYSTQISEHTGRIRSKSTINTARRILRAFLQWVDGYKETALRAKPEAIKSVRVRKPSPKAIEDHLIIKVIKDAEFEQDRLLLATLRESGMRGGELIEVRVSHLLYDQIQVTAGKDYTDRNVCITPALGNALRSYAHKMNRVDDDYLFQTEWKGYEGQMTEKTLNLRIQRCFAQTAGIHMYIHQLRHTAAVEMLRGGADLVSIQRQLGHKDLNTTQMYLRVYDTFVQEAYAKSMPKSILSH